MKVFNTKEFTAKVNEVRAYLKAGLLDEAKQSLESMRQLESNSSFAKNCTHNLANDIQRAIFEAHLNDEVN